MLCVITNLVAKEHVFQTVVQNKIKKIKHLENARL